MWLCRRWVAALLPLVSVMLACGSGLLDPTIEIDDVRFSGTTSFVAVNPAIAPPPESFVRAAVSARNTSSLPIERTLPGGCFIQRLQAFRTIDGSRVLAWDSDRRSEPQVCTDDLVILDLGPGESVEPGPWQFGVGLSEIRDSLPAGEYEFAVWIDVEGGPGETGLRQLGAGRVELP